MDRPLVSIGRNIERADGTASVIEAHLQVLLEDPWADEDQVCRSLLHTLGAPPPARALARDDVLAFAVDRAQPTSIAGLFGAAREHATRAQNRLPVDLLECLNTSRARTSRKVAP